MNVRNWFCAVITVNIGVMAYAAPPPQYDGGPGWWRLPTRSTFYRTANDPKAEAPQFFILAELPFSDVSKPLTIEVFGDYKTTASGPDTRSVLHGVFTKTPVAVGASVQRRLPDAVDAGCDVVTSATYHQSLSTDIPEDFRIVPDSSGKFRVKIPTGAQWIVLSVPDSYYGDNADPDDDLWIRFSRQ